jgi:hypothetical protein
VSMESLVLENLIEQVEERALADQRRKDALKTIVDQLGEIEELKAKLDAVDMKVSELEGAVMRTQENSLMAFRRANLAERALANLCDAVDGVLKTRGRRKSTAIVNLHKALTEAHKLIDVPF